MTLLIRALSAPRGDRSAFGLRRAAVCFMLGVLPALTAHAGNPPDESKPPSQPDPSDKEKDAASAENTELMLFDDVPMVVSATRQSSAINLTPVPISVVTRDAIHYSGLSNLAEVLQFYPGMDVLRIDRNNYAVGVRGFHHIFSDRTLLLLDGRNANNIFNGGIDLLALPLLMDDIERVEIVRGPGGASWGANAFNGVINIITKEPGSHPGVSTSSTFNEFGDVYSQLAWSASDGPWSWRLSTGYEDRESSEDAIIGDEFSSRDFSRQQRLRGDAAYKISTDAKLTFGASHAHIDQGGYGLALFDAMLDERIENTRLYARLDHAIDANTSWYLQLYGNIEDSNRPSLARFHNSETGIDTQFNFQLGEDHKLTLGGNVRWTHADPSRYLPDQFNFLRDTYDEYSAGFFIMDQWRVTNQLTLESQLRGDYYSGTSADWSGRFAALYALDTAKRHVLRASTAKAFRTPLPGLRDLFIQRQPLPPPAPSGIYTVNLIPDESVKNEEIYSVELGYFTKLTDHLTLRTDVYYQWYADIVGTVLTNPDSMIPVYTIDNHGEAQAPGAEIELAYKTEQGGASVWYAYNGFERDEPGVDVRAFDPSPNKFGASAYAVLDKNWTLTANYRWSDITPAFNVSGNNVPGSHRLDLTLARKFADGRGELLFGIKDIFDETRDTISGIGAFNQHPTPGRELFVRVELKF